MFWKYSKPLVYELLVAYKIVHRDVSINTIKNYVYNYDSSPHS